MYAESRGGHAYFESSLTMAEKQDSVSPSTSQCSALSNFIKQFHALGLNPSHLNKRESIEDEVEQKKHDHSRKVANSQMLWPFYKQLVEKWEIFVRDLLKEAVEVVYNKLCESDNTDSNPHLQAIVARSLLHHSSNDEPLHRQGASEMSSHLLSHPDLWRDIVERYKKHLLSKCDEVVCVFDGVSGINETFKMLFNTSTFCLSQALLPINCPHYYKYDYDLIPKETTVSLDCAEKLSTMLYLYYEVYCITSEKRPKNVSEVEYELFRLPIKPQFQERFGEIPGDFLHYFYRMVFQYKKEAYLYFNMYKNTREFFFVLAVALCDAVSKFIKEHFDVEFCN